MKSKKMKRQKRQFAKSSIGWITVLAISVILLFVFGFPASIKSLSPVSTLEQSYDSSDFQNISNPESAKTPCIYGNPFFPQPTQTRQETVVEFDLSHGGNYQKVTLIQASDEISILSNGDIKFAGELVIGDEVLLKGDKLGVVTSVKQQVYTPRPPSTPDANGNIYSRVLGKSERMTDKMLYLHTPSETIKTTPEHPFYTEKRGWIEAKDLTPDDRIKTAKNQYIPVVKTEIVDDPQVVYSLLVEGAHNFYVGNEGLLAHNCTPTIESAKTLSGLPDSLDSSSIRFTQDSIKAEFKAGGTLQDTINGLKNGTISPDSFPPIRVFGVNDQIFTLDNRRLFVFQQAGLPIRVSPATASEIVSESFKFTTTNCGISIIVRGAC